MNFCDFFAAEWRAHGQLLERMKVLPEKSTISEDEWEVAHTYMVVAFRKRELPGAAPQPPAPTPNPGHRKIDPERDVVHLEEGAGAGAGVGAGAAGAKRSATEAASDGAKRPRAEEATTQATSAAASGV